MKKNLIHNKNENNSRRTYNLECRITDKNVY